MNARLIAILLIALAAAVPTAAAQSPAPQSPVVVDLAAMAIGVMTDGRVIAAGTPLSSGAWGTDYITVSHTLGLRRNFAVVRGQQAPVPATPVCACSSTAHGIDVLILRVESHRDQPVVAWGDPATLKPGDELMVPVRKEFHPKPIRVKFLHLNLLEWTRTKPAEWPHQWHHVMVGSGMAQPGFSGTPWVRDGKVFGLLKGAVRPAGQTAWYAAAETATRVKQCLNALRYDEMLTQERLEDEPAPTN